MGDFGPARRELIIPWPEQVPEPGEFDTPEGEPVETPVETPVVEPLVPA